MVKLKSNIWQIVIVIVFGVSTLLVLVFASNSQKINSKAFDILEAISPSNISIFENEPKITRVDLQFEMGNGLKIQSKQNLTSIEIAQNFLREDYVVEKNNEEIKISLDSNKISNLNLKDKTWKYERSAAFSNKNKVKTKSEFFSQKIGDLSLYGSRSRVDIGESGEVLGFEGELIEDTYIEKGELAPKELETIALEKGKKDYPSRKISICGPEERFIFNPLLFKESDNQKNIESLQIYVCFEGSTFPVHEYLVSTKGVVVFDQTLVEEQSGFIVKDCKTGACVSKSTGSDPEVDKAFQFLKQIVEYFKNEHNYSSGSPETNVNDNKNPNMNCPNAMSDGIGRRVAFCTGMLTNDVMGHEVTHGVIGQTAGLAYSKQSGALNESYADIFGFAIDQEDYLMGEDSTLGTLRDFASPEKGKRPQPSSLYDSNYSCSTDQRIVVHVNSGIVNHVFYLLSKGGTKNGQSISSIGTATSHKIFMRALQKYLKPSSNFCDAYKGLLKSCQEQFDGNICQQVQKALDATEMNMQYPNTMNSPTCEGEKSPPNVARCTFTLNGGATPAATIAVTNTVTPENTSAPAQPTLVIPPLSITPGVPIKEPLPTPVGAKSAVLEYTLRDSCTTSQEYKSLEYKCTNGAPQKIGGEICQKYDDLLRKAIDFCANLEEATILPTQSPTPSIIETPIILSPTSAITPAKKFKIIWKN